MKYQNDDRIVMTLDAGGTNFVFSAMQGNKSIVAPVKRPSNGHDLKLCIDGIISGFTEVKKMLEPQKPVAISFAFPGPAHYQLGIIGDLFNLPAFRGGVALGPMLQNYFGIPTYINNDGQLYGYGEALAGYLPYVNGRLVDAGSTKQFSVLIGITLGTGFGIGVVKNGKLFTGDNIETSAWILSHRYNPNTNAEEEGVSIRSVIRKYKEYEPTASTIDITPKDIFDIAHGLKQGNQDAAKLAFAHMGKIVGDAVANFVALFDGIVVIGGGISGARNLIMPSLMAELNSYFVAYNGNTINRVPQKVYNLEDEHEFKQFLIGKPSTIEIPVVGGTINYDTEHRVGIAFSGNDTSEMIALGAYNLALQNLDNNIGTLFD